MGYLANISKKRESDIVVHFYNPAASAEVEAAGLVVQGQLELHSKLEASLGYTLSQNQPTHKQGQV